MSEILYIILRRLTFFARHICPRSSSFFFLLPLVVVVVSSDAPANDVSTSHTLTSTSLPANAKVVADDPDDERVKRGDETVRLEDDEEEEA